MHRCSTYLSGSWASPPWFAKAVRETLRPLPQLAGTEEHPHQGCVGCVGAWPTFGCVFGLAGTVWLVRAVVVVAGLAWVVAVGLAVVVVAGRAEVVPAECELELQASAVTASTAAVVNSKSRLRLLCMIRTPQPDTTSRVRSMLLRTDSCPRESSSIRTLPVSVSSRFWVHSGARFA